MKHTTTILGIDPGTQVTGYGVIRLNGNQWEPLDFGAIRPSRHILSNNRYLVIFEAIEQLIERFCPDEMSVESQFIYKNVQSALKLVMAKCTVLLAAGRKKIPITEYTPRKTKLAIVGHGNASKEQMQRMIQMQLKLPTLPTPADAADALALALCHAYQRRNKYV